MWLQELLVWQCLLCDGTLEDPSARLVSLCPSCLERLPRMIAPVCRTCGISLSSEDGQCLRCRNSDEALPGISLLRSACLYVGVGQDLIQAYKSDGCRPLAWLWAGLLESALRELWEPGVPLVPVPCRPANRRKRGYDPVGLCLSRLTPDIRRWVDGNCLVRMASREQKELSRADRRENLAGCLAVRRGWRAPERLVLVDDVCTTGATLSACAAVLRLGGCRRVDAVTLFRD